MIRLEVYVPTRNSNYIVLQHNFALTQDAKFVGDQFKAKGFAVLYFDISSKQIDL